MKRRNFIKLSLAIGAGVFLPEFTYAEDLNLSKINFSTTLNSANNAQTIILFLYGGASQLAGNLTNIEEIETASDNSYYSYFEDNLTLTKNKFWKEAGGEHMEELISSGDMTIFRSCYSKIKRDEGDASHYHRTAENQRGSYDGGEGILTNLAQILHANGAVNEETNMPFVTLEGESEFYSNHGKKISEFLKPAGFSADFANPYSRDERNEIYYTPDEKKDSDYDKEDASLYDKMDAMAQKHNTKREIKTAFSKRIALANFVNTIRDSNTPDLGENAYPKNNDFAKTLETSIKILVKNPDTKVITISAGDGLGGWDDHEQASNYVERIDELFRILKSGMAHIKTEGKAETINIMVFGEFGRNVNLNSAKGWDHGNLQNFYVLGGKGYFNHKGVVGETVVHNESASASTRIYLEPKPNSYWFEPISIAATLYKIYGIENPAVLTGGYGEIMPLFS